MRFKAGVAFSRFCVEEEVEAGSLLRGRNLAKLGRCENGREVGRLRSERFFSGKLNVWELETGKVRCCEIGGEFEAELQIHYHFSSHLFSNLFNRANSSFYHLQLLI